ncbi:MAG: DegV family protein [Lachnospira sp.]
MIKLFTDSTCDLSKDLLERYDISVIPLYIQLGDKSFKDGIELLPNQIYEWATENKKTPKTSSPDLESVISALSEFDNEGTEIIYTGISESMSSTISVVRLAAEELKYAKVYSIDSMNLSTGIGLQLLRMGKLREEGLSAQEIVDRITADRCKVKAGFVVDTLEYLYRGGRCNAVTALFASALKIKPEIAVTDGQMVVARKFRGNIHSVIEKYVDGLKEDISKADEEHIFITHSGGVEDIAEEIKSQIEALGYFKEVHITTAGGVIASHCGPKTLGVLFYSK